MVPRRGAGGGVRPSIPASGALGTFELFLKRTIRVPEIRGIPGSDSDGSRFFDIEKGESL